MNRLERHAAPSTDLAPSFRSLRLRPAQWLAKLGRIFPRNAQVDSVVTTVELPASPEVVWKGILFYEEVPQRPSLLLRLFLPAPVRTDGDKRTPGAQVHCTYDGGDLDKRITAVDAPHYVAFEVLAQHLGIEDSVTTSDGSYAIRATGQGSHVALTTRYHGHLRPRWLWRPFERFLAHLVHRHILTGMREVLRAEGAQPVAPPLQ
jgi:hypothetical protein